MAIQSSEIVFYRSETVTDTSANGGRMGSVQVADSVKNNLLPDVSQSARTAGITRLRKLFAAVENASDLALLQASAHLASCTQGQGWLSIFGSDQRETETDISTSPAPREYAAAPLNADVAAGAASFTLALEDSSLASCFQTGDSIWLGNDSGGEYFSNVSIGIAGTLATVTLDGSDQLANDYTAQQAWGATLLPASGNEITTTLEAWTETSATGTYDEATWPLETTNIGCVEDDWLLTFTSATEFSVAGTHTGLLATGGISSDYAPSNPDGGVYFTLRAAGFGGTWQAGDSIAFTTHPASMPLWVRHVVPAGSAAVASVSAAMVLVGESE